MRAALDETWRRLATAGAGGELAVSFSSGDGLAAMDTLVEHATERPEDADACVRVCLAVASAFAVLERAARDDTE